MRRFGVLVAGTALLGAAALFAQQAMAPAPAVPPVLGTPEGGYVGKAGVIDAARYLPSPPAAGSPEAKADREAVRVAQAAAAGEPLAAAVDELHMRTPAARRRMLCALDAAATPETAPALFKLMLTAGRDLSNASTAAKEVWKRDRPFVGDAKPATCYPASDPDWIGGLSWSYPSGHSATGWIWGLIMAQVAPDRAAEAFRWGASIGDHRILCGVHYPTDVASGRMLGSAVFARISTSPQFQSDLAAAKAEVAAIRAKGTRPTDCPAG